ncbi:hypothetical protein [Saccharopolyspora taberi]|uniref:VCBS repeat-containing protein n=1 Tax=Saccharopolyspora taberi TaxID=60895 RepID=A0ABN3VL40_9PSEU
MNRTIITGIAALSLAVLPCATANAEAAGADFDGDGRTDPVSLQQVSEDSMLLRVGLAEEFVDAEVPGNAQGQPVLPTDVNGDGSDEVMVPEAVGANTITYTVWGYSAERGLHPVRTADGQPLRLFEGGGARAVSSYSCGPADATRALVSVNAYAADDELYRGERVTYTVRDGLATVVEQVAVEGAQRDDPRLQADPATCAPLA